VDAVEDAEILDWLKRRIDQYHYFPPSGKKPGTIDYTEASNHALANMMAAQAFGALVGDRSMFTDAFVSWKIALESMRPDGSLPLETRRGARSLHYTNFQLGQLIATAEVAAAQGIDLYAQAPSPEQTIQKGVQFLLDGYEDFDKVEDYAKANKGAGPSDDYSIPFFRLMHLGWTPAYFARFGNDANIERLRGLKLDQRICSEEAQSEDKMSNSDKVCARVAGRPVPLLRAIDQAGGRVGEEVLIYMGYPAQCLQGVAPEWPILPCLLTQSEEICDSKG
jgi:hypothetical protein